MTQAIVTGQAEPLDWRTDSEIILAITAGDTYNEAVLEMARAANNRFRRGVFITTNRPYDTLRRHLDEGDIKLAGYAYIDCISGLTGLTPANRPDVQFIDSPTMLEKAAMRADQLLRRAGDDRVLLLDSLSTLAVYNGDETVAELAHNMITKLRMQQCPAVFLVVESQAEARLIASVAAHCDRMVRI